MVPMKVVPVLVLAAFLLPADAGGQAPPGSPGSEGLKACWRIRDEIRQVSEFTEEGLIEWNVFIGGPDDDDTNKDQYVLILIRRREGGESMTIAVTALERSRSDPNIKFAGSTKTLVCGFAGGTASLISADGGPGAWDRTAAEILRAVVEKKRLLKDGLDGSAGFGV